VLDVALLALALALASFFAHSRRWRGGLWGLGVASVAYFGFVREGCVCAVGSIQNVTLAIADSSYAIPATVVAFFMLPLLFALFFGRVFCAGVCPLGALQDLVIFKPVTLPHWLADSLGLLRHLYLGAAVLLAATGSLFLICKYDPFVSFFRLGASAGIFIYSGLFLLLALFVARPYCRFLCPYSVLLGWLSRFASHRLRTNPDYCLQCRLCEDACPMGLIRTPTPPALPEDAAVARRRLVRLLVLLPLVVAATAWTVSRLDLVLARSHPTFRLAERIHMEDAGLLKGTTVDSRTFRATDTTTEQLMERAQAIRASFRRGGWWLGGFLGLVVMLKLIRLSLWRTRTEYEPDPAECFTCGRCFAYCPQEVARQRPVPVDGNHDS
jgi:ferredoxin